MSPRKKSVPESKRIGRPSNYREEFVRIVRALCLLGATNKEIAAAFGVAHSTVERWMVEKPDFCSAIKDGRMQADAVVASSLFKRATGFTHETVKVLQFQGTPVYAPYTERVHPDVTACIFWLKNRRPDLWRDAHRHELTGVKGGPLYEAVDAAKKEAAAELRVWREVAEAE